MPAVTVKRVDGGKMSNYLNAEIKEGDVMSVMPPMGKFTVVPDASRAAHYVLFGGVVVSRLFWVLPKPFWPMSPTAR